MTDHVGTVVEDLADGGRTVLLATHDLGTVDRVADDRGQAILCFSHKIIKRAAGRAGMRRTPLSGPDARWPPQSRAGSR